MSNFRYCEMGLWTVVPNRLQSLACSLYKVPLQLIEQGTKGTISVIQQPFNTFGGFGVNLKSDVNNTGKSTNRNNDGLNKDTVQEKTQNGLFSKVSVPSIPFMG